MEEDVEKHHVRERFANLAVGHKEFDLRDLEETIVRLEAELEEKRRNENQTMVLFNKVFPTVYTEATEEIERLRAAIEEMRQTTFGFVTAEDFKVWFLLNADTGNSQKEIQNALDEIPNDIMLEACRYGACIARNQLTRHPYRVAYTEMVTHLMSAEWLDDLTISFYPYVWSFNSDLVSNDSD